MRDTKKDQQSPEGDLTRVEDQTGLPRIDLELGAIYFREGSMASRVPASYNSVPIMCGRIDGPVLPKPTATIYILYHHVIDTLFSIFPFSATNVTCL